MNKKKLEEHRAGLKEAYKKIEAGYDKFNVLLTSRVLDEGWNLPSVDCAIIMAGDSTAKQTIQRMGRVLRKKNKEIMLYQIYVIGTIEEDYANERVKLFKLLCSNYKELEYLDGKIYFQVWPGCTSSETRLIVDREIKTKMYDCIKYENQLFRFNTVTYRNDYIEVIIRYRFIRICNMHFLHIGFFI
jgi:superfamily II DNA or RNA helicase